MSDHARVVLLKVDLTGSNCGPAFRSVELTLDGQMPYWPDLRIRRAAAKYYAVPLAQVGEPRRMTSAEADAHHEAEVQLAEAEYEQSGSSG